MAKTLSDFTIVSPRVTTFIDRINWLYPTLLMVAFFTFYRLDTAAIQQWDEAHTGINAIEMLQTGDWVNLYFGGEPDKIRAKPPLVIWMVAANFSIFGYSAFALRLHSAIATLFIFFFLYRIVQLYRPPLFAFAVCLVVISVRGIIGYHVGRNGDFDAVLIAFLFGGLYFFLRYVDFMRYRDIYVAAILWGIAFWVKGPAFGVLFPGIFLYLLLTKRLGHVLRLREVYKALGIMLLFPIAWYLVVYFFGVQLDDPAVSGRNAFERMFLYDLKDRFTQTQFEGKTETASPLFLWEVLRASFRHWDLVFYGVLLGAAVRRALTGKPEWNPQQQHLLVLSVCIWLPLAVFLSMVTATKHWYFAPAIPFVAVTTVSGLWWLYKRYPRPSLAAFILFLTFATWYRYLGPKPQATPGSIPTDVFTDLVIDNRETLAAVPRIHQIGPWPAQRVLLDLYITNPDVVYTDEVAEVRAGEQIFARREFWQQQQVSPEQFTVVDEDEFYIILRKN